MVKSFRNVFKCNVYSLKKWFSDLLEEVREFVKKEFEYIDPILYVKSRFSCKQKYGKIKFEVAGNKYIIHLRGKFKWKIYWVSEKVIINPLKLW